MGTPPLTIRDWILYLGSMVATSTIAAFLYRFLSVLLINNPSHTAITYTLFSFSGLMVSFLIVLRFRKTRTLWLKLWAGGAPLFLNCRFFSFRFSGLLCLFFLYGDIMAVSGLCLTAVSIERGLPGLMNWQSYGATLPTLQVFC